MDDPSTSSKSKSFTIKCKPRESDKLYPHKHQAYTETFNRNCKEHLVDAAWRAAYEEYQLIPSKKAESDAISQQDEELVHEELVDEELVDEELVEKDFVDGMRKYLEKPI